jgi:hypothetical protein
MSSRLCPDAGPGALVFGSSSPACKAFLELLTASIRNSCEDFPRRRLGTSYEDVTDATVVPQVVKLSPDNSMLIASKAAARRS